MAEAIPSGTRVAAARRNDSIDAIRFVAFCAVVFLHMISAPGLGELDFASMVAGIARFAVPCFFIISGFFIPTHIADLPAYLLRIFSRLGVVFVSWEIFYNLIDRFVIPLQLGSASMSVLSVKFILTTLYTGGVAFHLWFLPSLFVCIALFVVLRRFFGFRVVLAMAALLYAAGLLIGPYNEVAGLFDFVAAFNRHPESFTARNGPFFGLLLVCLGYAAGKFGFAGQLRVWTLVALAVAGLLLQQVEAYFVASTSIHGRTGNIDFLLGTILYSFAIFVLLKDIPTGNTVAKTAELGRIALGMYCMHAIFTTIANIYILKDVGYSDWTAIAVRCAFSLLIIVICACLSILLARIRAARRLVS